MFVMLNTLPNVSGPLRIYKGDESKRWKETWYFANQSGISRDLVLEHYRYYYSPPDLRTRYMDATPNYMHNEMGSASAIAQTYHQDKALASSVRFAYVIRNPIDRMKSWWKHFHPAGHNPIRLILSCPTSIYTGDTMDCGSRNDAISL